jgi:hypothetical protein
MEIADDGARVDDRLGARGREAIGDRDRPERGTRRGEVGFGVRPLYVP